MHRKKIIINYFLVATFVANIATTLLELVLTNKLVLKNFVSINIFLSKKLYI